MESNEPIHCCEQMRMMVEEENSIAFHDGEYGIPIQDGGTSYLVIEFCPWCGKRIAKMQNDAIFDCE